MSDVSVRQERWAPVSAGEYDRRTRTIAVNLTVVEAVCARHGHDAALVIAAIVAHERVHALSALDALPHEEEARARDAAIAAAGPDVVAHIDAMLAEAWV